MTEQNMHDYDHAAVQQTDDLTIYDRENTEAWISIDTPMEITQ